MEIRSGTGARPRSRLVWAVVKSDMCSAASAAGTCEASQMSDCAKTLTVYCKFIKDFAKTACPLHDLTGDKPFVWMSKQQTAFEELKESLMQKLVLALPNNQGLVRLETDASEVVTGGVASQQQDDEIWKLLGFMSKTLNNAERNYTTYSMTRRCWQSCKDLKSGKPYSLV